MLSATVALGPTKRISAAANNARTASQTSIRQLIRGNYDLRAEVAGKVAKVTFSGRQDWPIEAALETSDDSRRTRSLRKWRKALIERRQRERQVTLESQTTKETEFLSVLGQRFKGLDS
jgi:hypothetical protein